MRSILLIIMFGVMLLSDMFGWKLGIWQGLSAKNAFLYTFIMFLMMERALGGGFKDRLFLKVHLPFILLIIIATISCVLTDVRTSLVDYTKESRFIALKSMLVDYYMFFLVFYYGARTCKDAVLVGKWVLWLVFLANIITIIDVYNIPDLGIIKQMETEANKGRLMGPIGEPNQYAAFLALFLPAYIVFGLSKEQSKFGRMLYLGASLVTMICLLLTGSRGGLLGLFVGAIAASWIIRSRFRLRDYFKTIAMAVPLSVIGFSIVAIKYNHLLLGRIEATTKAGNSQAASAGRTWIWEAGISVMNEHPLSWIYGMGWHTYASYVGIVPHNSYLWYLFGLGVIGLTFYLAVILGLVKLIKSSLLVNKNSQDSQVFLMGAFFGFIALLIAIFFVDLFNPWYFIWAYLGISARVALAAHDGEEQTQMSKVPAKYSTIGIKNNYDKTGNKRSMVGNTLNLKHCKAS